MPLAAAVLYRKNDVSFFTLLSDILPILSCDVPFLADVICRITAHMRGMLQDGAVLTVPSAPGPAPLKGTNPAAADATRQKLLCLTNIGGPAGLPQVSWRRLGDRGGGY